MSKTAKAAMWIMIAMILSKILGFVRELVFANYYGTGIISDVFVSTFNIPSLIIAVIGSAVATTYIPMYFEAKDKTGEDRALKFTNNVLNICYVLTFIIAILGIVFARGFVFIFAYGFTKSPAKFEMAVTFTRILMPGLLFLSGCKVMGAFLQVKDSFTVPSLVGIPSNIIIIGSIITSFITKNLYFLSGGALIALASQFLFQIPFARKKGFRYKPYLNIHDDSIKRLFILALPMFFGVSVGQLNAFVDKLLGSGLADGKLTALSYASKLNDFVMGLFVTSIVTVIYPKLAKLPTSDNKKHFSDTIVKSSNCVMLIVIPISIGFIILADPIVRILFQRGHFNAVSTRWTVIALRLFCLGLTAAGIRDILYRAFYSLSDTKTPMINSSIALSINIILNLILIKPLGHGGLALSTSISSILTVILSYMSLKRKTGYFGGDRIIKTGFKSLASALVMAVFSFLIYTNLHSYMGQGKLEEIISFAVAALIGAIVYFVLITVLKVEEVKLIFEIIKKAKKKIIR